MRVIHVLRKPLSEGNVAANVLKHGAGGLNIDATRLGGSWRTQDGAVPHGFAKTKFLAGSVGRGEPSAPPFIVRQSHPDGRWPANLILEHHRSCLCTGEEIVRGAGSHVRHNEARITGFAKGLEYPRNSIGYGDAEGMETVEAWDCEPGCPVAELDIQSGELHSQDPATRANKKPLAGLGVTGFGRGAEIRYGDKGGASRFFKQIKAGGSESDPLA